MDSIASLVRDLSEAQFRVHDGRRRIGLVFWRQRRRQNSAECSFHEFWKRFGKGFRRLAVALGQAASAGPPGTGMEPQGPEATEPIGPGGTVFERLAAVAGLGEWEAGLRSRIFRLRRPNIWARLHYGLDKDGVYGPKIEARGRRELKKLCLAGIPVSSWPSVMDESLVPDPTVIPYGFEDEP